jgi:alpha-L-rhamnosidase
LYQNLAGMQVDEAEPGYRHLIFKPQPVNGLGFVEYLNQTPYGKAGIKWQQSDNNLLMDITVPVGCWATIYFPAEEATERGKPLSKNAAVRVMSEASKSLILEVGAGEYHFQN